MPVNSRQLVILLAATALAMSHPTLSTDCTQSSFEAWAHRHGHHHMVSDQQRDLRMSLFCNSTQKVSNHNKRYAAGEVSYFLKLHEYSANTPEEWTTMMGTRSATLSAVGVANDGCQTPDPLDKISPAPSVDWRKQGKVTGVKNQQSCGSCWSFSAIGAMEGAVAIAKGTTWNGTSPDEGFSEDQCLWCSPGALGCQGGFPSLCLKHIMVNGGIDSEKDYPYLSENCDRAKEEFEKVETITSCSNISDGDEQGLQKALNKVPVSVAIRAQCDEFMNYGGGVLSDDCGGGEQAIDHAVLAVGYDKTAEKPYYIVKNSWGTSWGEDGYVRMALGSNLDCIACKAVYANAVGAQQPPKPAPEVACPAGTYNPKLKTPRSCPKGSTCCCSRKMLFFGKCTGTECCATDETCKDGHGCKKNN